MEFHDRVKERHMQPTQRVNVNPVLEGSLELADKSWKVALTDGARGNPAVFKVDIEDLPGRLEALLLRLAEFKAKWGLPAGCQVVLIHEAGQDGFWIARALERRGIRVVVIDAASVQVTRHAKRAKTDRLDALRLLQELRAWLRGERMELRVVHIPSEEAEAQRLLTRERGTLQKESCQHRDRMHKLLRTQGCKVEIDARFLQRLKAGEIRRVDGTALPRELHEELLREWDRLQLANEQFRAVEHTLLHQLPEPMQRSIALLSRLKGVGWVGAMRLVVELFWRDFTNRRQVGCCVGLVPQPYDSGDSHVDQGISKQGNRRVRALLIEMAWMWLRHQPDSDMAHWFKRRTQGSNKRGKRIAIVALARRLAIALWRYLREGLVPTGAQLKV
jgi:transposase